MDNCLQSPCWNSYLRWTWCELSHQDLGIPGSASLCHKLCSSLVLSWSTTTGSTKTSFLKWWMKGWCRHVHLCSHCRCAFVLDGKTWLLWIYAHRHVDSCCICAVYCLCVQQPLGLLIATLSIRNSKYSHPSLQHRVQHHFPLDPCSLSYHCLGFAKWVHTPQPASTSWCRSSPIKPQCTVISAWRCRSCLARIPADCLLTLVIHNGGQVITLNSDCHCTVACVVLLNQLYQQHNSLSLGHLLQAILKKHDKMSFPGFKSVWF